MDELSGESAPELYPGTAEELFQQAEAARRAQIWEEAIRLYRHALHKDPNHIDALHGLGLSCEAKGREPGYGSYIQSAMGEYRKMVALDPSCVKGHDALLAVSAKLGMLGELLEEYQARIAKGGDVEPFRRALPKLQTLFLMRSDPAKGQLPPPSPLVSFIFGLVSPGVGVLALAAAFFVRVKWGDSQQFALASVGLIKISVGAFFSFIGYRIFLIWRSL